jgi:hypothetical protein
MPKIKYKGIMLDSTEEKEFYMWCEEAVEYGVILRFAYHPCTFELSKPEKYPGFNSKDKPAMRSLVAKHGYTPDFLLEGVDKLPLKKKYRNSGFVYVDTKGSFQKNGGGTIFSINQKWVYQQYGVYVHKVMPEEFFSATWVPEAAKWTPKRTKIQKKYMGVGNVQDYLGGIKND